MPNLFSDHLSNERKEKLIDAWEYLKPWQKVLLYLRVRWYALPNILQILERIRNRMLNSFIYISYKAHWM